MRIVNCGTSCNITVHAQKKQKAFTDMLFSPPLLAKPTVHASTVHPIHHMAMHASIPHRFRQGMTWMNDGETMHVCFTNVATDEFLRETLVEKRTAVEAQGNVVRALKVAKTPKPEIIAAIEALNALKLEKTSIEHSFLNELDTLELCLFSIPSFKI
ncbi:hypothetical protein JHK82_019340 [Glycine max]|nr:hypothetical protein JHK86_019355 [Glycine max]KAG5143645.1 hypothetical protein JHK82_019340 [Glycine max]